LRAGARHEPSPTVARPDAVRDGAAKEPAARARAHGRTPHAAAAAGSDQPVAHRARDRFRRAVHAELGVDTPHVRPDRVRPDPELLRRRPVAAPARQTAEDIELPRREAGASRRVSHRARRGRQIPTAQRPDDGACDVGAQWRAAGTRIAQLHDQPVARHALDQVAVRARADRVEDRAGIIAPGKHDDAYVRQRRPERTDARPPAPAPPAPHPRWAADPRGRHAPPPPPPPPRCRTRTPGPPRPMPRAAIPGTPCPEDRPRRWRPRPRSTPAMASNGRPMIGPP